MRGKGRRQADLGEKAPGSVKSGLNGSCHSAAQPLICRNGMRWNPRLADERGIAGSNLDKVAE